MPHYFFHLRNQQDAVIDEEGRDVGDADQLPAMALREARFCVSQEALEGRIDFSQSIDVQDGAGIVVHRVVLRDAVEILGASARPARKRD